MNEYEKIRHFWQKKNIALFGLSRNSKSVSREIYDLLMKKGYHIYPINPNAKKIDSITIYQSLDDVPVQLQGAIIITNPQISKSVVKQCHSKGIYDLWFQYDTMDEEIKSYCKKNGMNFIYSCTLLHHNEVKFYHRWHQFFYRLFKI
jgi:uncharacterized protein